MKVAFDLDGVVYDMMPIIDTLMERNKCPLKDNSKYKLDERYSNIKNKEQELMKKLGNIRPFNFMKLNQGAHDKMLEYLNLRDEIYIITDRAWAKHGVKDTLERIKYDHLPVKTKNIIFSKNKGYWANKLGIAEIYEDSPKNIEDILNKSMCRVFIVDAPYNRNGLEIKSKRVDRIKW